MRTFWKLLLVLPLIMAPYLAGCEGQMSQDSAQDLSDQIAAEDEAAGPDPEEVAAEAAGDDEDEDE